MNPPKDLVSLSLVCLTSTTGLENRILESSPPHRLQREIRERQSDHVMGSPISSTFCKRPKEIITLRYGSPKNGNRITSWALRDLRDRLNWHIAALSESAKGGSSTLSHAFYIHMRMFRTQKAIIDGIATVLGLGHLLATQDFWRMNLREGGG